MLKKKNRLLTGYEFGRVKYLSKKNKTRYHGRFFKLYFSRVSLTSETKVGIVVPKTLSKLAVVRNRTKRVFREVVRKDFGKIPTGYWIVIYPTISSLKGSSEDISAEFTEFLQKKLIS